MIGRGRIKNNTYSQRKLRKHPLGIEVAILEVLATQENSWASELSDHLRKNIATMRAVRLALRRLAKKRMIKEVIEQKKGPRAKRLYQITTYGLFAALYYQKESEVPGKPNLKTPTLWRNIDKVAIINKGKVPLIFGKWDYFVDQGWRDAIVSGLKFFFMKSHSMPSILFKENHRVIIKDVSFEEHEARLVDSLTRTLLFPEPTPLLWYEQRSEWGSGWADTLLSEPDLKKYVRNELKKREKNYRKGLDKIISWKKYLERLKKE